jgi:EmrB/QacA subfamily drug resistance transporter
MGSTVSIALPAIGQTFALNAVTLSWIAMAVLLAAATFLVPFGRIADIYGRKRIFVYGTSLYTLASLFAAIAPSAAFLISSRALQGIGAAMIFGTGMAILTSVFPPNERGRALGINVAAVYVGLSIGPPLGGFLTQYFGWRSVFYINLPLGLITLVAALWKLKGEWAEAKGEKFDFIGSILYGLSLIALVLGFSKLPAMTGVWLITAGTVGIFAFIQWEMRTKSPVLNITLFRHNTVFSLSNLAALINYMATNAVTFLLSLYLQYIEGLPPQRAGLVLIAQPVVMAILSPLAGRLSDRIEPRVLASLGMAVTTVGLVLLIFLNQDRGIGFILLSLGILGLGFALFSSPNSNAIMSSVDRKFYGVASGTLGTMRITGQMFSLGIATLLFAIYIGQVQITPEYYPLFIKSTKTAFIIFAALCFGGIFASLARGKTKQ